MHTETRSQYKIWRFRKGRSMTRWMSDEQVARYKVRNPHWRWQKIRTPENRSYQASLQSSQSVYARPNNYGCNWGRYSSELAGNRLRLQDKKTNPVISYDDILDVQLALKKGV